MRRGRFISSVTDKKLEYLDTVVPKSPLIEDTQGVAGIIFSDHPASQRTLCTKKKPQSPLPSATAEDTQHFCKENHINKGTHTWVKKWFFKKKKIASDLYCFTQELCSRKNKIQPQQSTVNFSNHESILSFLATQLLCMDSKLDILLVPLGQNYRTTVLPQRISLLISIMILRKSSSPSSVTASVKLPAFPVNVAFK